MSLTDPVADFLTRVRNAINARHQKVDVPLSKLKVEIARILKDEGYIANYKTTEEEGRKVLARVPEVQRLTVRRRFRSSSAFRVRAAGCTSGTARFRACWAGWGSAS